MYHGTPEERAELRRTVMRLEDSKEKESLTAQKAYTGPEKTSRKADARKKKTPQSSRGTRRSGRFTKKAKVQEEESEEEEEEEEEESDAEYKGSDDEANHVPTSDPIAASEPDVVMSNALGDEGEDEDEESTNFPIVVTTYEMIIRDRVHLAQYQWGYVVVDEGHRLKNLDCKLMQEIKKYPSAGRMILTGTPLHVCLFLFLSFAIVRLMAEWRVEQPGRALVAA